MIVACPECSRPFELADDQVAALVQLECPHCSFRMILDFEAANDPSLVEAGMQMASGWRSAADYHASFSAPEAEAPRPHLQAVPEPELEPEPRPELEPEPIVLSRPGRVAATSPATSPAASLPPTGFSTTPPSFDAEDTRIHEAPAEASRTVVDTPPPRRAEVSEDAPTVAPPSASPRPRPHLEVRLDASMEEEEGPTQIHTPSLKTIAEAQAPRTSDVVVRKQVVVAGAAEEMPARTGGTTVGPAPTAPAPASLAEARVPPHTPPGRPVVEDAPAAATREPARPRPAPRFESMDLPGEDEKPPKSSALATVMVLLLLLSALGLVGASLALEQTWDPRPLLEKLYRQNFK
jgi:DNA-directed RNA polymerase subunit RPC12/RpoP